MNPDPDTLPPPDVRDSSPRGIPLLGSVLEMRRDVLGFMRDLSPRHGDLVDFRLGPLRCCAVSHPTLVRELLVERHEHTRRPWDLRQLRVVLGEGLLTSDGDTWARQRTLLEPVFSGDRIRAWSETMRRRATARAEGWRDGSEIDLYAEARETTLEIAAETLLGAGVVEHAAAVAEALDEVMDRFERMLTGWIPLPFGWPTPGNLRLKAAGRELDRVAGALVEARRRAGGPPADLLGTLLAADGLSEEEVRDQVVIFLVAGHETTALAVTWTLDRLARHPALADRVAAEADALDGDAPRLPLARAAVREALRLYPPAWGVAREPTRDLELGGRRIRKGTQVFANQWVVHRDPRFFEDPERFDPERKEGSAGGAWFPFGMGPRACVGAGFATVEAPIVVAAVLRRWRLEPGPEPGVRPAITLRPDGPVRAILRRR